MSIHPISRRARLRWGAFVAGVSAAAGFALAASPALAAYRAEVSAGTLEITGNGASDKLALQVDPANMSILQLDVGEDGTVDFAFDRSTFSKVDVQAGDGNDEVRVANGVGDVMIDGGPPATTR